jgi:2-methylcitrate dehydratase PrpD
MENLTRHIAEWSVNRTYDSLPENVIDSLVTFSLDHFGVTLGGSRKASSKIIKNVAAAWGPQKGTSTIVGNSDTTSAPFAALINGTAGHALELDDDHRTGTQHPGIAIIPPAFAVAEERGGITGREFIEAIAVGYEIMIRLGEAHLGKSYNRGFHPTGTCGSIGAAIAAGRIMKLNVDQMVSAIGLGASQSAGLLTFRSNGAWSKRFHAGHASMAGIIAAGLAEQDFRGPSESLLSPEGWLQAFAYNNEFDVGLLINDLGDRWSLIENSIKVHACCRFAGPIVDATLETVLREDIKPNDVEEAVIRMAAYPLTRALTEPRERKLNPTSVVDAQFSAPFAVATSIVRRRAFIEEYSEEGIRNPEVLAMARKVRWEIDPEAERLWPSRYPCEVEIALKDGRRLKSRVEWPKGDPENPVSTEEVRAKFATLATPVIGDKGVITAYDRISDLRDLDNVAEIGPLLRLKS